jgi:PKD repeat protein
MRTPTRPCLPTRIVSVFCVFSGALSAACSVQETPIPSLSGPSELALRIAMQVTPDEILQDGSSQASLLIEAASPDGRPARGMALRIATSFEGIIQDFGTLSAKTVVTGEDGRARVVYTAPPRPAQPVDDFNVVTFQVTPIGTDFRGEVPRTAQLRLLPPGGVLPPNVPPVPDFSFTPSTPSVLTNVVFDASATTDEGATCGPRCTYFWDFGDGQTGLGVFVTHQFTQQGNFQVRLTATDARGASTIVGKTVTVGAGQAPTASFTYSPTAPLVNEQVFFTAEASRAASGRRIVSYDWNFGSGRTGTGVTISKGYDAPGTYPVTLTVTDDAGNQGTATQQVTVAVGQAPTAAFSFSPTAPAVGQQIFFTGEASRAAPGSRIVSYDWNFGSGRTGTGITINKGYDTPGTYVVTLTVTDDQGRMGTTQQSVTVGGTGGLTATLVVSPINGGTVSTNFFFDTRGASAIVEYRFNFGDNTPEVVGPSPTATHTFAAPGSYLVSVTVKDSQNRTSIARITVNVQ